MDKILIFNGNNQQMEVDVVRYFSDGGNNYFVFSLNELDSQGHMNIYVTKVINQNGSNVGTNIVDDVEWSNLKSNLQRIIKENRANGNAVVSDISIDSLQGLKILDRRALKLLATSVDMLNLGYVGRNSVSNDVNDDAAFAPKNVEHNVFSDEEVVYNEQSVAPQYNEQPVAPQYIEQSVAPQYIEQSVAPQYIEQSVAPQYIEQSVAPQYIEQSVAPQYSEQSVAPQYSEQPVASQYNEQPVAPQYSEQSVAPQYIEQSVAPQYIEQSVAPQYNNQPVAPQYNAYPSVQNNVNGVNYEMLYLQEKANNERLIQERDSLVNELNAYKIKISDIKNILSK